MTTIAKGYFITSFEIAELCSTTSQAIRHWSNEGKIPEPLPRVGKKRLWVRAEIEAWIAAKMPSRKVWEEMKLRKLVTIDS